MFSWHVQILKLNSLQKNRCWSLYMLITKWRSVLLVLWAFHESCQFTQLGQSTTGPVHDLLVFSHTRSKLATWTFPEWSNYFWQNLRNSEGVIQFPHLMETKHSGDFGLIANKKVKGNHSIVKTSPNERILFVKEINAWCISTVLMPYLLIIYYFSWLFFTLTFYIKAIKIL